MGLAGGLALGGASLIGGYLSNRAQRAEAQRNRDFQERMRNTSWQAAVEDMRAAGLNPALAYQHGGAQSPSGSMAQQSDIITPAVGSALQARRLREDILNMEASRKYVKAQTNTESMKAGVMAAQKKIAELQAEVEQVKTDWYLTAPRLTLEDPTTGAEITGSGTPKVVEKLIAELEYAINRAEREGATAATMKPLADLADTLGMWMPALAMGGGLVGGAGVAISRIAPFLQKMKGGRSLGRAGKPARFPLPKR